MSAPGADIIIRRARSFDVERAASAGASGAPTPEQFARIASMWRREPAPGDVYAFGAVVSTTQVDDYFSWMDRRSLDNGARAANSKAGLPLMVLHATYSSLPVGRWFEGRVSILAAPPVTRAVPLARDVFERLPEGEAQLTESAYIARGTRHDGLIEDMDTGVLDGVSWAATANRAIAPDADFLCDVCNTSFFRLPGSGGCRHYPGQTVDTVKGPVIVTGRYTGVVQREASLVPIGSNPSAQLVQRAAAGLKAGDLSPAEVAELESIYGAAIGPTRYYSIPAASGDGAGAADAPQESQEAEPMTTGNQPASDAVRTFLGDDLAGKLELHRAAGRDEWEMAARVLSAEIAQAGQKATDAERRASEQDALVRQALGIAEGEDLATGFARVAADRAYGQAARMSALDALCSAYVRAHGATEGWDKDAFLARRAAWSGTDIASETAELERIAKAAFRPGSVAERDINDGTGADGARAPQARAMVPGLTNA